jgi:hypothetical protein
LTARGVIANLYQYEVYITPSKALEGKSFSDFPTRRAPKKANPPLAVRRRLARDLPIQVEFLEGRHHVKGWDWCVQGEDGLWHISVRAKGRKMILNKETRKTAIPVATKEEAIQFYRDLLPDVLSGNFDPELQEHLDLIAASKQGTDTE